MTSILHAVLITDQTPQRYVLRRESVIYSDQYYDIVNIALKENCEGNNTLSSFIGRIKHVRLPTVFGNKELNIASLAKQLNINIITIVFRRVIGLIVPSLSVERLVEQRIQEIESERTQQICEQETQIIKDALNVARSDRSIRAVAAHKDQIGDAVSQIAKKSLEELTQGVIIETRDRSGCLHDFFARRTIQGIAFIPLLGDVSLGAGGYGTVSKVVDLAKLVRGELSPFMAFKCVLGALKNDLRYNYTANCGFNEAFISHYLQKTHPERRWQKIDQVVSVHQRKDGWVGEFLSEGSLMDYLAGEPIGRDVGEREVRLRLLRELQEQYEILKREQLFMGDIKTDNIMLEKDDKGALHPKFIDFGTVRFFEPLDEEKKKILSELSLTENKRQEVADLHGLKALLKAGKMIYVSFNAGRARVSDTVDILKNQAIDPGKVARIESKGMDAGVARMHALDAFSFGILQFKTLTNQYPFNIYHIWNESYGDTLDIGEKNESVWSTLTPEEREYFDRVFHSDWEQRLDAVPPWYNPRISVQ